MPPQLHDLQPQVKLLQLQSLLQRVCRIAEDDDDTGVEHEDGADGTWGVVVLDEDGVVSGRVSKGGVVEGGGLLSG